MPVYNGERYLNQAIDSILFQTFADFEFIIVDDGSTDGSLGIIKSYEDRRIRVIQNEKNLGLIDTLNKGLDLARGEFIARMDQDDICMKDRLEEQISVMKSSPNVGVCGTWARLINKTGDYIGKLKTPVGRDLQSLYWRPSPVLHPTCMIRTSVLNDARYDPHFQNAEDYELWMRLARKTSFCNIPRYLLRYRIHDTNMTVKNRENQLRISYSIFQKYFQVPEIGYEQFLSLILVSPKLDPLRRAHCLWRVSKKTTFYFSSFVKDNLRYLKWWFKSCVS